MSQTILISKSRVQVHPLCLPAGAHGEQGTHSPCTRSTPPRLYRDNSISCDVARGLHEWMWKGRPLNTGSTRYFSRNCWNFVSKVIYFGALLFDIIMKVVAYSELYNGCELGRHSKCFGIEPQPARRILEFKPKFVPGVNVIFQPSPSEVYCMLSGHAELIGTIPNCS